MNRRKFLSLSAMTYLTAVGNTSIAAGSNLRDARDFDIAFITDVHIEKGELAVSKFKRTISEINALKPAFVWDMGDMSLYPNSSKAYLDCVKQFQMPLHACPGNHDIALYDANPRKLFNDCFGPAFYSFDFGGVHFIALDVNIVVDRQGKNTIDACLDPRQIAWLKADLEAVPDQMPIICGVHIPIVSTYIQRRGGGTFPEDFPIAPQFNESRAGALVDLLSSYNFKLVLQGHAHENERITVKGIEFVTSISVCGCWWRSGEGFERGVDNVPRGYRIIEVRGGRISHRYVSSCESKVNRRGEFEGLDDPIMPSKNTAIIFNCYDAPNGSTAEVRIDSGPWMQMQKYTGKGGYVKMQMPHHFILRTDTTKLAPGEHQVTVRVTLPDDTIVKETTRFFATSLSLNLSR
ncbi:MAG: metallophosphoesterase [Sedimentisphaerales bacterium]|nr:metallophosphoesterase [Sedimentisphaerales bacterium]